MIFREDYGKGEPTDVMAEAIWKDVPKDAKRVVSVGGGSILDLSSCLHWRIFLRLRIFMTGCFRS